jgi:hypothetical protein
MNKIKQLQLRLLYAAVNALEAIGITIAKWHVQLKRYTSNLYFKSNPAICLEDDKCLMNSLVVHCKTSGKKQVEAATGKTTPAEVEKYNKYMPYKAGKVLWSPPGLSAVQQARIVEKIYEK